jgi:manganese/zinc/iron transport system permease protein
MIAYNTAVVLIGVSTLGASCGLVGGFAVLRRRALTGDALAHAALPGLCLAFLVVGARFLPALLAGALLSGLLGILIISGLRNGTRVREDAAIGLVLSVFFGAGIVLSHWIQKHTTTGSQAGLDSYILGKTAGMLAVDVYLIAAMALGCLLLIVLLYKEFQLIAFDPDFARVQGWPVLRLDLLLMLLLAVTVVIGLPAVGVVMIAALLILPGATARFWTERLGVFLALAAVSGCVTGALGTWLSASFQNLPTGPIIVLCGTGLFLVSALLAPRRGLVARWLTQLRLRRQVAHDWPQAEGLP